MKDFPKRVRDFILKDGFVRHGKGGIYRSDKVVVYFDGGVFRRSPDLVFALWFNDINEQVPEQYNHFHIYGDAAQQCKITTWIQTEKYMKSDRELDQQLRNVLEQLPNFTKCLKKLADLKQVKQCYDQGEITGLVRREADIYLKELADVDK